MPDHLRLTNRLQTARAAARLVVAELAIRLVPLGYWRASLGLAGGQSDAATDLHRARRLAAHVDRAALRLPFKTRCLARSAALSWLLRREGISHRLVIAARPAALRKRCDALHAWVECCGTIVIGDLEGPWITLASLPSDRACGNSRST